jgi:hypothetical protein
MEHTLNNLLKFSAVDLENPKHSRIDSFHYDHSGHVIATNSHVLFASKRAWEIKKAGKSYSRPEYEKGFFVEAELEFPEWKQVIPKECGRKVTIQIPEWFEIFGDENRDATMVLDYTNTSNPYFKITATTSETCLGFNAKYLSCFAGEKVSFLIAGSILPSIVVSSDSKVDHLNSYLSEELFKEDWFYILMPIKMDEEDTQEVYL